MKDQKFIPTGCRDIEIWKFEVVAKTQFLSSFYLWIFIIFNFGFLAGLNFRMLETTSFQEKQGQNYTLLLLLIR